MENKYTSLELSKKLAEAGCDLKGSARWFEDKESCGFIPKHVAFFNWQKECSLYESYDILNDICVKYAKEFFGEEIIKDHIQFGNGTGVVTEVPAYLYLSREILYLMQEGKKQEAEKYIWDNCKFNKANKTS